VEAAALFREVGGEVQEQQSRPCDVHRCRMSFTLDPSIASILSCHAAASLCTMRPADHARCFMWVDWFWRPHGHVIAMDTDSLVQSCG
jgi:hypothetical protein